MNGNLPWYIVLDLALVCLLISIALAFNIRFLPFEETPTKLDLQLRPMLALGNFVTSLFCFYRAIEIKRYEK